MIKSTLFLILTLFFISSASKGQDSFPKPSGNWLCQTEYGSVGLNFISDKQLVYDGETLNYTIEGNVLKVQSDYSWIDYPFEFNKEELIITYPEGYRLLFNKVSESNASANLQNSNSSTQGSGGRYLSGTLCDYGSSSSYSSGSSYSHSNRLYFDGRGNFQYGTESSYSGNAGSAYGGNNAADSGTYRIVGNTVVLTAGDGSVYTLKINFIQDDGQITELYYGESLYAAALCD